MLTASEVARIAAGLTKAQREALAQLSEEFVPGPYLPDDVTDGRLSALREAGLVERQFLDMGPPSVEHRDNGMTWQCAACWHFRLTPLGLAVRAYLTTQGEGEHAPRSVDNHQGEG